MEDTLPARPEDMMERLHRSLDLLKGMNLPAYSDQ